MWRREAWGPGGECGVGGGREGRGEEGSGSLYPALSARGPWRGFQQPSDMIRFGIWDSPSGCWVEGRLERMRLEAGWPSRGLGRLPVGDAEVSTEPKQRGVKE